MDIKELENSKLTSDEQIEVIKKVRGNSEKLDNARVGEALLNEQWRKATEYAVQHIYDYLVLSTGNNFDGVLKQYKRKYNMEDVEPDDDEKDLIGVV